MYHEKALELHDEYGPVVRTGPNELSFIQPEAWASIMGHRKTGDAENPKAAHYVTPPLITGLDRTDHARVRRLMSHGFSSAALREQEPMMQNYINMLIQRLHENCQQGKQAIDICAWFNYTTFDIIGDLTFGEPFGCLEQSAMHPWVELVFASAKITAIQRALGRFPLAKPLLPFLVTPKMLKEAAQHEQLTNEKVSKRLELSDARPDLVHGMTVGKSGLVSISKREACRASCEFETDNEI